MADWRGRAQRRWAAVALAATLAGCQTVVPRGVEPRPQPGPPRPVRPTSGPENPLRDQQRDRVALLVPLSGSNGGVGQSIANATQLALLDTRSEKVRITTYDTSAGAGAAAERAIGEGAQLILGPLLGEDVRQVLPVARAARVPVVSFSNDSSLAGSGAYLMGYAPAQSIERVVGYARAHGVATFGGLTPAGVYGQRASTTFLRAVEGAGGKVVSLQTYPRAPGGLAAAAAKLGRTAPYDAVLIADSGGTAAVAAPLVRRTSPRARLLGTELWNADGSVSGKAALNGAWYASVSDTLYRQFAAKYQARFAARPYRLASLGYDAVLLTVRISRDWPVGNPFPEERLRDRGGFSGIDGAFRFGRDGVAERALQVQEIRAGGATVVSPAPAGFGER